MMFIFFTEKEEGSKSGANSAESRFIAESGGIRNKKRFLRMYAFVLVPITQVTEHTTTLQYIVATMNMSPGGERLVQTVGHILVQNNVLEEAIVHSLVRCPRRTTRREMVRPVCLASCCSPLFLLFC